MRPEQENKVTKMENIEKRLLTIEETAHILGIAPRTIRNRCGPSSKNPFPIKPKRVGRLVRFRAEDVEAYIQAS
jgi:predicted DNA-binding transcriptional regulator AlpA